MISREKIARILINSEKNEIGGIPLFLNIDNEEMVFDLRKMHSFIVVGKNSAESVNALASQINPLYVVRITDTDVLYSVYEEVKSKFDDDEAYFPYQVIIIPDLSIFQDNRFIIKELLCKGVRVSSYFICACKTDTVVDEYNMLIPVKMYDEYMDDIREKTENLFTFSGTVKKIKFKTLR